MAMCQALAEEGHNVTLISQYKQLPDTKEIDPFVFYGTPRTFHLIQLSVPRVPFGFVIYQLKILWHLLRTRPDLVYGRFLEGCRLATTLQYQTIYEAHIPVWHKNESQEKLFKKMITQPTFCHLVVISQALKELYTKRFPLLQEHTLVAHDGANPPTSHATPTNWPGRTAHLQIGMVGHLYKGRGVEIIAEIAKALPDVDVHFIGGTEKDIAHWKQELTLPNVFFHGFIEPAELSPYINALDVCLMPYQRTVSIHGRDTLNTSDYMSPLKLFQYMAHGKAIVASDLPVIREVLDEQKALLVPPEDHEKWIEAVTRLQDSNARKILATNAYNDFIQHYTWRKRADQILGKLK
ncbi:MAG: glycosyltransferase family 4 protein [bacterium]|nr:glycosyltransferase family 4 protein [bacterium]